MCRDFKLHRKSLLEQKITAAFIKFSVMNRVARLPLFSVSNSISLFTWHFHPIEILVVFSLWLHRVG